MHTEPQIKPLSKRHRNVFFWFLVLVFLMVFPSLIFYTTGYRISMDDDDAAIVTTGGVYITTENLEVDVYLDGENIEKPRLFRSAYYIQHVEAGNHRVVVQRPDLNTWVKDLPIDPHVVIEAAAFNMPAVPHLRPITEFITSTGTPVMLGSTSTDQFPEATTTVQVLVIEKAEFDLDIFEENEEFVYVASLFSTTSSSSRSVFERLLDGVDRFRFATTSDSILESSTSTEELVSSGDTFLLEKEGELYARWEGQVENIPYYFCVSSATTTDIGDRYGDHVAADFERFEQSTTTPVLIDGNRKCRQEIRVDRKGQDVFFYDFFPGSADLVLLQLEDGLYVTEIDDRAWQNTQLIYRGEEFLVVIENDVIYVQDDGMYFEVITEIEPN